LGRTLVFEGDSLMCEAENDWSSIETARLLEDSNFNRDINVAYGGERIVRDMVGQGATQIDPHYNPLFAINIALVLAGINDAIGGNLPAADILAGLEEWCLDRRAAGWKTIVLTWPPVADYYTNGYSQRPIVNAALLDSPTWCDVVADAGSDPRLIVTDETIYVNDGLHLTELGQETIMAPYMVAAIRSLE
jgi:lysophospholipase L1-like esterase